jgi:hypothetical protein
MGKGWSPVPIIVGKDGHTLFCPSYELRTGLLPHSSRGVGFGNYSDFKR